MAASTLTKSLSTLVCKRSFHRLCVRDLSSSFFSKGREQQQHVLFSLARNAGAVESGDNIHRAGFLAAAAGLLFVASTTNVVTSNDAPSEVDDEDLPEYSSEDVAKNDGKDGKPTWMSYGGMVYNVTDFIPYHPGGTDKIVLASGSAIEPYWNVYRQHFASDLPQRQLEKLRVGRLNERDQERIDAQLETDMSEDNDPYRHEPVRNPALKVHNETPMNAEAPPMGLVDYITPTDLFYIRNHHPVPLLSDVKNYRLTIDLTSYNGGGIVELSLDDLKLLPKVEITATLQCSGNRRGDMNQVKATSGTTWGQGAVSTAKWGGARLRDVLKLAGLDDPIAAEEEEGLKHVRFESIDGMKVSIGIEKAASPYGDCIVAYEMNGEPLPRDHGFPVRCIVPGYNAVRSVKWLQKIQLAKTEAEGPWQRGLNYKILPPNAGDATNVNLDNMPTMMEASLFSGITKMERDDSGEVREKKKVMMKASGWAWAGGGRNIVRVDLTGDGGKTWTVANITRGGDQKFGRAWAWVFWECTVPAKVKRDGTVELASKAVDLAFNVQPERVSHTWNVRGLGNNSWYRARIKVV